jgi:hypothetical protein
MTSTKSNGSPKPGDTPEPVAYDLFNLPPDPVVRAVVNGKRQTSAERFEAFDEENPDVYRTLRQFALNYVRATGATRIGVQMIVEKLRYETGIVTRSTDFKINNDFAAYYARKLMALEPDLAGRFETRTSDADLWAATTFPKPGVA